jgi:hypothetical protein
VVELQLTRQCSIVNNLQRQHKTTHSRVCKLPSQLSIFKLKSIELHSRNLYRIKPENFILELAIPNDKVINDKVVSQWIRGFCTGDAAELKKNFLEDDCVEL